jgi:hypothetical protein
LTVFKLAGRLLGLAVLLGLSLGSPTLAHAQGSPPPLPGICSESDRFGVAMSSSNINDYNVGILHAGWYHNFGRITHPLHPYGMTFVQTIRLSDDGPFPDKACSACPTWEQLAIVVQANPGSLWFVGSEPDRQEYVRAERYAELYHEFYTFLKGQDPACQVGIGGVVQSTPIRLQYLDMILTAYYAGHGASMPVDVWNIHNYVLREADDWGGGIPPETDPALAILYALSEHDMLDPHPTEPEKLGWKRQIILMRKWMHDRGYRDRPLIISEYGLLMPEIYGYDYPRVRDFMLATFDWLLTCTDSETGYPADGNRLVQAWAWYSLNYNEPPFQGAITWYHLFDPDTTAITALGLDYSAYTASLTDPLPGTIDLRPTSIWHTPPEPAGSNLVTMTIKATIYNGGAETVENVLIRFERDGVLAGEVTIPSIAAGESEEASVVWSNLTRGQAYQATVTADPNGDFIDCDPFNNSLSISILVTDMQYYLPFIGRNRSR